MPLLATGGTYLKNTCRWKQNSIKQGYVYTKLKENYTTDYVHTKRKMRPQRFSAKFFELPARDSPPPASEAADKE